MIVAQSGGAGAAGRGVFGQAGSAADAGFDPAGAVPGAPQDEHLFWAALFGWYVVQGAGPLSLDHILEKGLGLSPLPLAGPAMAASLV